MEYVTCPKWLPDAAVEGTIISAGSVSPSPGRSSLSSGRIGTSLSFLGIKGDQWRVKLCKFCLKRRLKMKVLFWFWYCAPANYKYSLASMWNCQFFKHVIYIFFSSVRTMKLKLTPLSLHKVIKWKCLGHNHFPTWYGVAIFSSTARTFRATNPWLLKSHQLRDEVTWTSVEIFFDASQSFCSSSLGFF